MSWAERSRPSTALRGDAASSQSARWVGRTVPSLGLICNPMNLHEGTRRLALLLGVVGALLGGYVSYLELQTVLDQRASHNRFEQLAASDAVKQAKPDWFVKHEPKPHGPWEDYVVTDPNGTAPSEVDKDGIKKIHWSKNYGVESIETENGQIIIPTPAPAAWQYLFVAICPIIGFFIPWGSIRAIGWVVTGFARP